MLLKAGACWVHGCSLTTMLPHAPHGSAWQCRGSRLACARSSCICLQLEEAAATAKAAGLMRQIKTLHGQVQQVEVRRCCWLQLSAGPDPGMGHPVDLELSNPVAWMSVVPTPVHSSFQASCWVPHPCVQGPAALYVTVDAQTCICPAVVCRTIAR